MPLHGIVPRKLVHSQLRGLGGLRKQCDEPQEISDLQQQFGQAEKKLGELLATKAASN